MARRAVVLALAALAAVGGSVAAPQGTGRDGDYATRQAELDALRGRIESLKQGLERDVGKRDVERERLDQIERQMAHLAEFELQTRRTIRDTRKEIERLTQRREELEAQVGVLAERLSHLVRAAYMMGRQQYLKLLLEVEAPESLSRALAYYRYLASERVEGMTALRSRSAAVEALARRAVEQAQQLQIKQDQLERATLEIENLRAARRQQLALLDARILDRTTEVERLRANERRLSKLVDGLREEAERRRLDAQSWDPRTDGRGFAQMQGSLDVPVRSRIAAGFGQTNPDSGMRWDGIWFSVDEGEAVRAVYRGVVSFADWFRGFGLLLIIDHGDGYMSLYSHNEALHKSLGDPVDTGEIVAAAGGSGSLTRPGLYFEIRENGTPRDPLLWCRRQ